jgi:subtilase family serine protease
MNFKPIVSFFIFLNISELQVIFAQPDSVVAPTVSSTLSIATPTTNISNATKRQIIPGHIPEDVSKSTRVDRLDYEKILYLSIGLPLRNQSDLKESTKNLHDPSSPQYLHFLTAEQFTTSYGPSEHDYQAVIDYVKSKGLTVFKTFANREIIGVSGKVGNIEKAFNIHLYNYRRPDGSVFFAPDSEPSIDIDVPVLHISGLDNTFTPIPG